MSAEDLEEPCMSLDRPIFEMQSVGSPDVMVTERQAYELAERSYRRGFQQGAHLGGICLHYGESVYREWMTKVAEWRYPRGSSRSSWNPAPKWKGMR